MARPKAFKTQLKQWRAARKMPRAELARRLGVPYRTLEDWEAGRHTPQGLARRMMEEKFKNKIP